MLRMTGALLIHDAAMMEMPINLARRRMKHGELKNGRDSRHTVGVT